MPFMRRGDEPRSTHQRHRTARLQLARGTKHTEPGVLTGDPESAECVQRSDDSRNSAIHNAYRISLRPSSVLEPRHPSLKVLIGCVVNHIRSWSERKSGEAPLPHPPTGRRARSRNIPRIRLGKEASAREPFGVERTGRRLG